MVPPVKMSAILGKLAMRKSFLNDRWLDQRQTRVFTWPTTQLQDVPVVPIVPDVPVVLLKIKRS
jgi:hypothetical protein